MNIENYAVSDKEMLLSAIPNGTEWDSVRALVSSRRFAELSASRRLFLLMMMAPILHAPSPQA